MKFETTLPAIYQYGTPIVCTLLTGLLVMGCTSSLSPSPISTQNFTGVVSAGLVSGATVNVYALNSNGSKGNLLATGKTDVNGNYALNLAPQTTPIVVTASGGNYKEEASGSTISLGNAELRTILSSSSQNQQVGVTPVTEIASQYAVAAIAANTSVALKDVIDSSNHKVSLAMGLSDITMPPADPKKPATSAGNTQAAQYALVLGTLSQIAKTASTANGTAINSLDIAQALATSLTYNGSFQISVGSSSVPVPNSAGNSTISLGSVLNAAGGSTSFSAAMNGAMSAYVSANGDSTYANVAAATTYTAAPPVASGDANLTPPIPPSTLPSNSPTVNGPPPTPTPIPATPTPTPYIPGGNSGSNPIPAGTPQGPVVFYNPNQNQNGTTGHAMDVEPSVLDGNGNTVTACTISPTLPAGLSINATTCAITGTPSGTSSSSSYTVTATAGNFSTTTTVSLSVSAASPHVFVNASALGAMVSCGVDPNTGAIQACNNPVYLPGGGSWGSSSIRSGNTAIMYVAGEGGTIDTCSLDLVTGQVNSCSIGGTSGLGGANQGIVARAVASKTFLYDWGTNGGNSGIYVCATSISTHSPNGCTHAESTLTTSGASGGPNGYTYADWTPNGVDLFSAGNGSTYAYVTSNSETVGGNHFFSDAVFKCLVSASDGTLSGCSTSDGVGPGVLGALTNLQNYESISAAQVSIQTIGGTTYLYILGDNIYKCTLNSTSAAVTPGSCVVTQGAVAQYTETFHNTPWHPVSISFSNLGGSTTYAYIADGSHSDNLYVCTVGSDGTLSNCTSSNPTGLHNANPWGNAAF